MEIVRMDNNTWRFEDEGVRFFLLTGTNKALLIDSGMNVNNSRDVAHGLTELPVFLLNTHSDMDHTGSNEQFDFFYMHPAEEEHYRGSGNGGQIVPIHDGDKLDLGERKLKIIHLPGHTPGSVAVLDIQNRRLISGDPVQTNGRIFMFGETRNMRDYIESLEKLDRMSKDFDEIWPSHGDLPVRPEVIKLLYGDAKRILAGEISGTKEQAFGKMITAYDLGYTVLLCDE